ncbi:MAG: hypothetical protein R6X25_03385 [Candidatus Krumholzibacteriia bacterium]
MRKIIVPVALVTVIVIGFAAAAGGYGFLGDEWKLYYPEACALLDAAADDCTLCHGAGVSLNPYGTALQGVGNNDFEAVENLDSDFDGRTNGEEILQDCTLPGDTTSPADLQTWTHVKALFR